VRPEVEKLKGKRLLCFYGEEELDSLCPHLEGNLAKVIRLKGGPHFGCGDQQLTETILREANVTRQGSVED
jgi:type IV secretory pathway VirJ component